MKLKSGSNLVSMLPWLCATWLTLALSADAVTLTNEYWIDDNTYGSNAGTIADPFIVTNDVTFDSKMAELTSKSNTVIHLLPGNYVTSGFQPGWREPWSLKSGSRLLGAGMRATTIKLTNDPGYNSVVIASACGAANLEVADLTVDANGGTATTHKLTKGVTLFANNSIIQRVRVINQRGDLASTNESFGIYIVPAKANCSVNSNSTGNVIRECIAESFHGDYISAIGINAGGGTIENCAVYFPDNAAIGAAYNCAGAQNLLVSGNYAEGASVAYYSDTDSCTNFVISHNSFKNCGAGIGIGSAGANIDNVSILFNTIELSTAPSSVGGIWFWRQGSNRFSNINIVGNTIRHMFGVAGTNSGLGINLVGVSGARVRDNTIASNLGYQLVDSTDVSFFNNFNFDGLGYTNINQIEPVSSIRRTLVTQNTTLTYHDRYVGVSPANSITITLPPATGRPGKDFIIVDESGTVSGARTITVNAASGEVINQWPGMTINSAYGVARLISTGFNWVQY